MLLPLPKMNKVDGQYKFDTSKWFAITITFLPYYSPSEKFKLIEKLPKLIVGKNAWYSIEYHKKPDKTDNVLRPHVHMLLRQTLKCNVCNIQMMSQNLTRKFGRTEVKYLETQEDVEGWYEYINKDVDRLNSTYPQYKHWREYSTDNEIDPIIEAEIIADMDDYNKKSKVRLFKEI